MDFKTINTGDAAEVWLTGRLEFTDHDRLSDIIALVEQSAARRFVLDLSGLEFIDSAGLGMLLVLQDETESRNIKMIVRGPAGDVRRSIELARLSEVITVEF
ncbi:stage II sporulation protein AA (anti-sigma F factor antagonist) [Azospirillum lipoferum]|uniref:Anti-sigma factor antagonist n=1 Tax=Azospirillum lipoferum TaxID=193 RepID=A0A5A9GRN6_AZOLI|nr:MULTISPECIES: STAS domain-containing protein [Azospirillum]KAA0596996.1 STAS domain-containing protein [Azospirillum lipoferum]MCP1608475.1 stage II sporulation protein AA (anti-sigma F factor antagonist) [Azospirillum lipoferum]MDW5536204.1 STAS domain-containing protein [Azospirillum sp. NL1]